MSDFEENKENFEKKKEEIKEVDEVLAELKEKQEPVLEEKQELPVLEEAKREEVVEPVLEEVVLAEDGGKKEPSLPSLTREAEHVFVEKAEEPVFEEKPEPLVFVEKAVEEEKAAEEPVKEEPVKEPEPVFVPAPVVEPPKPKNYGLTFDNITDFEAHKARILIAGVGGAGNNTINALEEKGVSGAVTVAVNTDVKHLRSVKAKQKVLIGKNITKGLGAGGYPDVGKNAAMESKKELKELVRDVDLVFITCGLGGGTGTGAAPVIARFAKEAGAIVIAAVTLPFKLEGARIIKAEEGLANLRQVCDTVIAIENQRLLEVGRNLPLKKAFGIADNLIASMIKGITETIYEPSLVNLDYADVKAVMRYGGVAAIGIGEGEDEDRALVAVQKAMNNPLLDVDYNGAKGAVVHVTGGYDLRLEEVNRIGNYVQSQLDPDAQVIWGARILPEFEHKVQVITIITGVKSPYILGPLPKQNEPSISKELGIEIVKSSKKK